MSLWDDYKADAQFAQDFPYGVPGINWTNAEGRRIPLIDMTDDHIINCMNMVGEDDPWYTVFEQELKRRKIR